MLGAMRDGIMLWEDKQLKVHPVGYGCKESKPPTRSDLIHFADPTRGECTRVKGSNHLLIGGSWLMMSVAIAVIALFSINVLKLIL